MTDTGAPQTNEPAAKRQKTTDDKAFMLSVFTDLSDELVAEMNNLPHIGDAARKELSEYYKHCLSYTVPGGKLTRGLSVLKGMQIITGTNLTAEQKRQGAILGWCVELLQAAFLVADDVMDNSKTRRGAPCWYKLTKVTMSNAINDALLLLSLIHRVLRRHFQDKPYYGRLLDIVLETSYQTEIGQHLDTNGTLFGEEIDLSRFTLDRYRATVRYKTAFYSFYLSCALAMIACGETDHAHFDSVKTVCLEIGEYFQVQDDYLDCYGDEAVIGKIGTDIQEAKCSWLVCKALEKVSEEQRALLQQNYGVWDDAKVAAVKAVFASLNLEADYRNYEEQAKASIEKLIGAANPESVRPLLEFLLGKIYKRDK